MGGNRYQVAVVHVLMEATQKVACKVLNNSAGTSLKARGETPGYQVTRLPEAPEVNVADRCAWYGTRLWATPRGQH